MDKPPTAKNIFSQSIIFLLLVFLSSCAMSVPEIVSVDAKVVFDYEDNESLPEQRLSVFTDMKSNVLRTASISVKEENSGYVWNLVYPTTISSSDKQWAGYTNLAPVPNTNIKAGMYSVTYTNALGDEVKSDFAIMYPEELNNSKALDVPRILGNIQKENVAVFSKDSVLLFYGQRKRVWETDERIFKEIDKSEYLRTCYSLGNVMCFMPKVYKENKEMEQYE